MRFNRPADPKGKCTREWHGLTFRFNNGWLMEVINPKGKRAPVWVGQTAYPGFTVYLEKAPFTRLGYGYRRAERLAVRLALLGHKRVFVRG